MEESMYEASQEATPNEQAKNERQKTAEPTLQHDMDAGTPIHKNVGSAERLLSLLVGAVLLLALRRRLLFYLSAAGAAGYLLYRGITGRCLIYEAIEIDTTDFDLRRILHTESDVAPDEQSQGNDTGAGSKPRDTLADEIDETLLESFPASDPPSTW
jgi:hypothetical protein